MHNSNSHNLELYPNTRGRCLPWVSPIHLHLGVHVLVATRHEIALLRRHFYTICVLKSCCLLLRFFISTLFLITAVLAFWPGFLCKNTVRITTSFFYNSYSPVHFIRSISWFSSVKLGLLDTLPFILSMLTEFYRVLCMTFSSRPKALNRDGERKHPLRTHTVNCFECGVYLSWTRRTGPPLISLSLLRTSSYAVLAMAIMPWGESRDGHWQNALVCHDQLIRWHSMVEDKQGL